MKKGFTLIELLAVIVILAIIAVIATPIVLDIINDTKESATLRSADFYISAVDKAIMNKKTEIRGFSPESCNIKDDGNLLCDEVTTIKLEMDGEKPIGGAVNYEDGKVTTAELIYETIIVRRDLEGEFTSTKELPNKEPDNVVYFDVAKGTGCSKNEYDISNSKTGYNGIDNKAENQTSCLKFYQLNSGSSTVNLLLDHNTTAMSMWYDGVDNTLGPLTALSQLKLDTQNWQGTITPSNVTVDSYTIDYSGFKARLISVSEITQITGNTSWTNKTVSGGSNWFYFNTNSQTLKDDCKEGNTSNCSHRWLYDRTGPTCEAKGCLNDSDLLTWGFWTDTYVNNYNQSIEKYLSCNSNCGFGVSHRGRIGRRCINEVGHYGIRPVIVVSKDKLN